MNSSYIVFYAQFDMYCLYTYWGLSKMFDIWQKRLSNVFASINVIVFLFNRHYI